MAAFRKAVTRIEALELHLVRIDAQNFAIEYRKTHARYWQQSGSVARAIYLRGFLVGPV